MVNRRKGERIIFLLAVNRRLRGEGDFSQKLQSLSELPGRS